MKFPLTSMIIVLAACSLCLADIAPNPLLTGGATASARDAKETPVAMTWEDVDLYPTPAHNTVAATFLLKNTSDQPAKLEVGFPSYNTMPLKDFSVKIDGNEVKAELKSETVKIGPPHMNKTQTTQWMVWPMEFAAGAEKKVAVAYWVPPVRSHTWTQYTTIRGRPTMVVDDLVDVDHTTLPDDVKRKAAAYGSGYVLLTGAGWKGNIGKATIRLHYGPELQKGWLEFLDRQPGQAGQAGKWSHDQKAGVETLVLENFEPDGTSDIRYQFRGAAQADQLKLLEEGLMKGQLDPRSRLFVLEQVRKQSAGLEPQQARERLMPVLEHVIPPVGAPIDVTALSPKVEDELQAAFTELMTNESSNERLITISDANIAFIDAVMKKHGDRLDPKRKARWMEMRKKAQQVAATARKNMVPQ